MFLRNKRIYCLIHFPCDRLNISVLSKKICTINYDLLYLHVFVYSLPEETGVAQSVQRLATGCTVRGSNPGWGEIFRTIPNRSWGPPKLRVIPGSETEDASS